MHGTWRRLEVGGKPADVYDLADGARPRFGVLFLHPVGLETLAGNEAFSRLFDELGLACICPLAGQSWWADRLCPEFDPRVTPERHLLERVVPAFTERWGLRPPAIGLLGISMGGQGAIRLAFRQPRLFPVAAGIASALDYHEWYGHGSPLDRLYDSKEQCRQDTALLHIHPGHYPAQLFFCIDPTDPWFRGNDRLHEKLMALGIPHECDLTSRAGGHSWSYFDAMADRAVRFLDRGLQEESRRLL